MLVRARVRTDATKIDRPDRWVLSRLVCILVTTVLDSALNYDAASRKTGQGQREPGKNKFRLAATICPREHACRGAEQSAGFTVLFHDWQYIQLESTGVGDENTEW